MFTIYDGREEFYQWDKDRKLIVDDASIKEVHFCNKTDDCSLPKETYTKDGLTLVDVPNSLLQTDWKIRVYGYTGDYTKHEAYFKVNAKSKPLDYVYTEEELWTAEKAVEAALEEAKASGEFKGDKGDRGEPGAIKFIVVYELPATGDPDAIYLLSMKDGTADNFYNEYIFVNGYWECIGSTSVDVNLDSYVKHTDYATYSKGGAVKVGAGLYITGDGALCLRNVRNDDLQDDEADAEAPLKAHNISDIVRNGLTKNAYTLSDTEKKKALNWLGVYELIPPNGDGVSY